MSFGIELAHLSELQYYVTGWAIGMPPRPNYFDVKFIIKQYYCLFGNLTMVLRCSIRYKESRKGLKKNNKM